MLILFRFKRAFVGHFFLRAAKKFSARFIADAFLDHIYIQQVNELIACTGRANKNIRNLISVVQFLIYIHIHTYTYIHTYIHIYIYIYIDESIFAELLTECSIVG